MIIMEILKIAQRERGVGACSQCHPVFHIPEIGLLGCPCPWLCFWHMCPHLRQLSVSCASPSTQPTGPDPRHSAMGTPRRGLGVISAHGSEELLSSPVCHFWNRKLFLKERDILILRHITLQNVFERCHISSVKGPELFTRNSACFAGCRLGPGVDGRKSEGRGSPPQGLGTGTTSSRCTGHVPPACALLGFTGLCKMQPLYGFFGFPRQNKPLTPWRVRNLPEHTASAERWGSSFPTAVQVF